MDSQLYDIEMQKVLTKALLMKQYVKKFVKVKVEIDRIFYKTLAKMKQANEQVVLQHTKTEDNYFT